MRKSAFILISLILLITSLTFYSCISQTSDNNISDSNSAENIVVDASGNTLKIPGDGKNLTIASVYAVAVPFIVALNLDDQAVAINCKSKFWIDNVEALGKAGSVGKGAVDLEALAKYEPSVMIHRSNDPKTVEAVEELGISVLCISAENMDDILNTIDVLGKYFGVEKRANQVTTWMQSKFKQIDEIVNTIPKDERVSAIVMGGEPGRIAGGDMLQSWMVEKAGGINPAKEVQNNKNWSDIGLERIFTMNPEYIFCTSSTVLDYSPEELLNSSVWSDIRAAKNEHIALIPAKIDSWDIPGVAYVIGTMWMLNQMYPTYFSAEELSIEIDAYYELMFGRTFDSSYLGYSL